MKKVLQRMGGFLLAFLLLALPGTAFAVGNAEETQATIQIYALDGEAKPILGFVYEIVDAQGHVQKADLTEKNFFEIQVPFGTYTIREVITPQGYQKNAPVTVTLPSEEAQGNVLKLYPKHHELVPGPQTPSTESSQPSDSERVSQPETSSHSENPPQSQSSEKSENPPQSQSSEKSENPKDQSEEKSPLLSFFSPKTGDKPLLWFAGLVFVASVIVLVGMKRKRELAKESGKEN